MMLPVSPKEVRPAYPAQGPQDPLVLLTALSCAGSLIPCMLSVIEALLINFPPVSVGSSGTRKLAVAKG